MAAISDTHKRLIVQRLATFVSSSEIIAELKDLGATVSPSQIAHYNPELKSGEKLHQKWHTLHKETREQFIQETASIAISHKSFRLRELMRLYRNATSAGRPNAVLGAQLLEQAAKEMGEAYTNRRVLTTADPLKELANILGFTPEQLAALLATDGESPEMAVGT